MNATALRIEHIILMPIASFTIVMVASVITGILNAFLSYKGGKPIEKGFVVGFCIGLAALFGYYSIFLYVLGVPIDQAFFDSFEDEGAVDFTWLSYMPLNIYLWASIPCFLTGFANIFFYRRRGKPALKGFVEGFSVGGCVFLALFLLLIYVFPKQD